MKRIGFHYYPDTKHYRQSDLAKWLPILQRLGASWLVMISPSERAIPEHFISGLIEAGIQPIVQFPFPPDQVPTSVDLKLLFKTYSRWGVQYIVLFDRPNLRNFWKSSSWAQTDLVERFLDIYLPIAESCLNAGLIPIFPALEPGGDYWDTAFLRASLQGIQRRRHSQLLQKLVIGAYAWAGDRSLDWGIGGPERWPGTRPYFTPKEEQDHRGFRIFDWYDALIQSVLVEPLPIFLFGMGCPIDDGPEFKTHTQKNFKMAQFLRDETIPVDVIGGVFWLVGNSSDNSHTRGAWFHSDGKALPIVDAIQQQLMNESIEKNPFVAESWTFSHYLLIPAFEWGVSDFHFDLIRPFVREHQPTIGFSVEEAVQAKRVTVVGDIKVFPEEKANKLRLAGCIVDRICGDGTLIASP